MDALYGIASSHAGQIALSINYPVNTPFKGAVFTKTGVNWYGDYYDKTECGGVQLKGTPLTHESDKNACCDVAHIKKGYASITPIRLDRTHHEILEQYKDKVKFE